MPDILYTYEHRIRSPKGIAVFAVFCVVFLISLSLVVIGLACGNTDLKLFGTLFSVVAGTVVLGGLRALRRDERFFVILTTDYIEWGDANGVSRQMRSDIQRIRVSLWGAGHIEIARRDGKEVSMARILGWRARYLANSLHEGWPDVEVALFGVGDEEIPWP